jgi:hypothetical protein
MTHWDLKSVGKDCSNLTVRREECLKLLSTQSTLESLVCNPGVEKHFQVQCLPMRKLPLSYNTASVVKEIMII